MPVGSIVKVTITATFLALTALEFKHVLLKTAFGEAPITPPISSPVTPTPTETPLSSPEQATPTPTDTPPLTVPEQGENPTLTPTPTVTVTPTVVPVPNPAPKNNNSGSNNNSNNNSGGNNGGGGGNSGPSVCTNEKPKSAPYLFSAKKTGKNTITLTWMKGWGPVNGYTVWYGQIKDASQYTSASVTGEEQVKSYTIGALNPYAIYYFKIQPQNSCKTGDFSNIITSTGRKIFQTTGYTQSVSYAMPGVTKKKGTTVVLQKKAIPAQIPTPVKKTGFFDFLFK